MCPYCFPNFAEDQVAAFRQRDLRLNVVQEACGLIEQLALVAANCGVGIALATSGVIRRKGVAFVPLADDIPAVTTFALWRRDDSRELLHAFLDTARDAARSSVPEVGARR